MSTKCCEWDIRGCPVSWYMSCEAYKAGKNCWEVKIIPCCKREEKVRCPTCEVYLKAIERGIITPGN